jgi:hypothetical protein
VLHDVERLDVGADRAAPSKSCERLWPTMMKPKEVVGRVQLSLQI